MTMSARAYRALMRLGEDDAVLVWLLTIEHPDLPGPLRFTNDSRDLVSRGATYVSYPFEIAWVTDDDRPAAVQLRIANVDGRILDGIRGISSPPQMRLAFVLADDPDRIEAEVSHLELREVEADAISITGRIGHRRYNTEPWPKQTFGPREAPALQP